MGLRSEAVIDRFGRSSPEELAFQSQDLVDALASDLSAFPKDPPADPEGGEALHRARQADSLFNRLRIPVHFSGSPFKQIRAWEFALSALQEADRVRYDSLHKETPFYFLGIASFLAEDFERATFYFDCALDQDCRLHGERWYRIPSGMFVRLDETPENQAARSLVVHAQHELIQFGASVEAEGGDPLTLEKYRTRLVNHSVAATPALRSVVTALLSFLLEVAPRRRQLDLSPPTAGTCEPFLLHLLKGGILFESIIRSSAAGAAVLANSPTATLNVFLQDRAVYQALGLTAAPQGLGSGSLQDLIAKVGKDAASGSPFGLRAIRALWGVRNTTGHNLAWHLRPTPQEYEQLVQLVVGALMLAINRLFADLHLEGGVA